MSHGVFSQEVLSTTNEALFMLTAGVPKPKPEAAVWDSKRKARTSNYNSTMICAPTLVLPLPPLSGEGGGQRGELIGEKGASSPGLRLQSSE